MSVVNLGGLSSVQAREILKTVGPNQIQTESRYSTSKLLLAQFKDPIMLLLLAATSIAMFLGQVIDSLIILGIVIPTALLGFYQERRAGKELEALLGRVKATAKVIRDSKIIEIPVDEIVPGDLVSLSVGSQIPADLDLVESNQLLIDESALTGESFAVEKQLTDQVFLGTHVAGGGAIGRVIATGSRTKYGELAQKLATANVTTSFEEGSLKFGKFLMRVMLLLVVSIFIVNLIVQRSFFDSILFSLALAVGMTPQFLTVIMTISLSRGASQMAKAKVLVRRLDAIQDFGSMTVLCSDKTGTLTQGDVQLSRWQNIKGDSDPRILELALDNAYAQTHYQNPIDQGIIKKAQLEGLSPKGMKAMAEVPYDFVRRRLSVAIEGPSKEITLITKGAFVDVLALCTKAQLGTELVDIETVRKQLESEYEKQANLGNRVILLATKQLQSVEKLNEQENDLVAQGLLIFFDPVKTDAANSVAELAKLNVRTVIVTGDNPVTTARVAAEVGLPSTPHFTGADLENMSDEQLLEAVRTAAFFAAVNPVQKERIVRAFNQSGETVGYFGDGINDALALRAADVGISVDNAVDVARESADIVLLDKNLDVLTQGLRLGRQTFANTMTYIRVTISASFGNVFSVVVAAAFLPFLPLLPMQILLLNFLSGFPHIAIATDRADNEDLGRPKQWDIKSIRRFMLIFGLLSSAIDIALYWLLVVVFKVEPELFRSIWYIESLWSELVAMLVLRTKRTFWRSRPSAFLLISCLVVGIIAIAVTLTPGVNSLLGFAVPTVPLLLAVAGLLVIYAFSNEILKRWFMV